MINDTHMISIVTPCLNIISEGREELFHKMMESVHHQSFENIEHIVVDNDSDDGTGKILNAYLDRGWITNLVQEKKRGIYPAMNSGFRVVQGDFVNIMNTDDYFSDLTYLSDAVEALNDSKIDFVHADRLIKSHVGNPDTIKKGNELQAYFRMPFRHQTMLVRKSVFDDIGLFDEDYQICSDYKWILQMLLAGKRGYYLPKTVVCSLDGGASSNREKCIEEVTQVLYECYGQQYGLTLDDCHNIYLRKISDELLSKITSQIPNKKIVESLKYCYESEKNLT